MRRWYHEVSADWLKARRLVLTATEVAGLVPEYKRYLKETDPGKIMPGFAALWCQKHSDYEPDVVSTGAAARGHIMEPWAIEDWNSQSPETYHHWDDCIIFDQEMVIGFSPDGLNVPQKCWDPWLQVAGDGLHMFGPVGPVGHTYMSAPSDMLEVKCYEPAKHMKAIVKPKSEKDELMQLAMGFAVCPSLERARIIWFCPGAPHSLVTEVYTKAELQDKVDLILEIAKVYKRQAELCEAISTPYEAQCTENQVYRKFITDQADKAEAVFMVKG